MDKVASKMADLGVSEAGLAAAMPALPPGRLALKPGLTVDETVAELKQHPLFMTDLDDTDPADNPDLAALQALAFDGTPLENATNFKEQGNECFRAKRWADAKEFYTKGIAVLLSSDLKRKNAATPPSSQDTTPTPTPTPESTEELTLLESLYVNRAATHLSLRNHRSTTLDCAAALRLNPANLKALYRSARALLLTDRLPAARDACERGLALSPTNPPLLALSADITAREAQLAAKEAAEARAAHRERLLRAALAARGIVTRETGRPPEMEDARVKLVPDEESAESSVVVPVLLLYPEDGETDFIKAFGEAETLGQHFGYVFPLPWDREGRYTAGGVECFAEAAAGGLVKVGKGVVLLKVLGEGMVEVVDGLVKVFVVPKGRVEGWVARWKETKGRR
ncbi:hypothetical protein B0T18DRAFT_416677 [Schizothecium vesticola]|uniref:Cns1/TTC4 wheel domain-containing protein n=1 Tax=Schizothecium vesticola TaxID=314040 RepID=A0AA40ERG8_9PEZI|nr:hypothetical protein B0T18DRAFT_416677 [Schizothecium vesticola]